MEALLLELVTKLPWLAGVLVVVGICRLVIKPLMSIAHSVAAHTESKKDDELVAKVESSGVYKGLIWVLDYLFSLKLIK